MLYIEMHSIQHTVCVCGGGGGGARGEGGVNIVYQAAEQHGASVDCRMSNSIAFNK